MFMAKISFFTPVNYTRSHSCAEKTLSALSNYFYLGGVRATVIQGDEVRLDSGQVSWQKIALKVATYVCLFPLTLTLFAINFGLRYQHNFTIISSSQSKINLDQGLNLIPPPIQPVIIEEKERELVSPSNEPIFSQPTGEDITKTDEIDLNELVNKNDLEGIKIFIQKAKKEKGWTWCHIGDKLVQNACRDAIHLGHQSIVEVFLDEGLKADDYAYEKNGEEKRLRSLKYLAIKAGPLSILKLLVNRSRDNLLFYNKGHYEEAMRVAISRGHADVIEYLLKNGGNADGIVSEHPFHQTLLGRVALKGQKSIVDLLIKYGADIQSTIYLNDEEFRKLYNKWNSLIDEMDLKGDKRPPGTSEMDLELPNAMKEDFIEKRQALVKKYSHFIQLLLENAIGINFDEEQTPHIGIYEGLTFLKNLNLTGFNFVGVSLNGKPVTREMLDNLGLKGADQAIVTQHDIDRIEDEERKMALLDRLNVMLKSRGEMVSKDGVFNLVPLVDAAKRGFADVVKVRLTAGVNPKQIEDSNLAMIAAAKKGFLEIVQLLVKHSEIAPSTRLTAAQKAQKNGFIEIFNYLTSLVDVNEQDCEGNALIHKAIKAKDIEEIKRLISKGADINLMNGNDETPLLIAASSAGNIKEGIQASKQDIALIKFLLLNHADPNKYTRTYSPLNAAANAGSSEAVKLLLPVTEKKDQKSLDAMDQTEINTPWYVPLLFDSYGSKEWLEILSLLKEQGADLNGKIYYKDETILYLVVQGFPSFAEIEAINREEGRTENQHEDLIRGQEERFNKRLKELRFLLENGADPQIPCGQDKQTPLHILIEKIDLSFIEGATEKVFSLLLEHGANINALDAYGFTPLHEAAKANDLIAATCLINNGANVKAETNKGSTPLCLAKTEQMKTLLMT